MDFKKYKIQTRSQIDSFKSIRKLLQKRWLVVVFTLLLTGFGAALTGVLFKTGIETLETWRLELIDILPRWFILPILGGLGGFISGTLITKISPAASGSGVSQIMAFLRHRSVPMDLKVGMVKLIAGITAIGSGFPLGPEGPAVQMGGSVAWQMAQWLKAPIAFRRVIVAAGGGAGIAAIFSAPIGGFIYAIEELLSSARPVVLLLVVVTTFLADSCADILQSINTNPIIGNIKSSTGFLVEGKFNQAINLAPIEYIDVIYLIILGIFIGILAELYCKYVLTMQRKGNKWFRNKLTLRMVLCGILLGIMFSTLPEAFHRIEELQAMIVKEQISINVALGSFCVLFLSTGLAAASGAPGGLFYPMLTLGGAIGLIGGSLFEGLSGQIPVTYIFAGMGAFVSACSRTPITAMFLAFALTKQLIILKPLLISCIASFLVARIFHESSIYERQIAIDYKLKSQDNN